MYGRQLKFEMPGSPSPVVVFVLYTIVLANANRVRCGRNDDSELLQDLARVAKQLRWSCTHLLPLAVVLQFPSSVNADSSILVCSNSVREITDCVFQVFG